MGNIQWSQILSASEDAASNDEGALASELYENTSKEEDFDSDLDEEGADDEWHGINEGGVATNVCWEEEELIIDDMGSDDPVNLSKFSRRQQQARMPVTEEEMNTFIGILLIMVLVRLHEIRLHLSQADMYPHKRIKSALERGRLT
ncbi:PREDICTED: uncharacterized protein LOC108554191 [Eufriesea mexicana]|uniref:uncharacterized protein LOC108554191 n=1 Tax=Eufriesea mexicana TaxID=516756 RepID=UPI00083C02BE|nr:PREDICTED: uncharacterized protein LOC108554191 [Eufriesea mexicana]